MKRGRLKSVLYILAASNCHECLLMAAELCKKLDENDKPIARWAFAYAKAQLSEASGANG